MNSSVLSILLVTENKKLFLKLKNFLHESPFLPYNITISSKKRALSQIKTNKHTLYILDVSKSRDNLSYLKNAVSKNNSKPYILILGKEDIEFERRALTLGASDFLVYGQFNALLLDRSIRYAIERKRAEIEKEKLIRAKIEKFEVDKTRSEISLILESITNAFLAFDKNWNFTYVNNQIVQLLGRKREELIGKNVWKLFPKARKTKFFEKYHEAVEKQIPVSFEEYSPYMKRWFLIQAYPTKDGLSAYYTDITERREQEARKDEFIGLASHELKTPITTLKAFTQLLQRQEVQNNPYLTQKYLVRMEDNIDKLTNLIGDLLDISSIESGKIKLNPVNFYLDELISEVVSDIQLISRRHLIIIEEMHHTQVAADKNRFSQVLMNIILNSIKYSPYAREIRVGMTEKNKNAIVSIKDFGIGIPKEKHTKVFNRYFRVAEQNSHPFPGLGLGLYIAQEIMKLHKGSIWFDSAEGKGSTFYVQIPKTTAHIRLGRINAHAN